MSIELYLQEWDTYAQNKELIQRDIDIEQVLNTAKIKIFSFTGIRRSGKSSILLLIKQYLIKEGKKSLFCNLEDLRLKTQENVLDEILKFFGDEGVLLLDEITNIKNWDSWLTRIHEMTKNKLSIICTSSIKHLIIPSKTLRGRMIIHDELTLSFKEFLLFKRFTFENKTVSLGKLEKLLEEYVIYGGFPEIALIDDEVTKITIILSYFRDILGLDVADHAHVSLALIEIFGKYILEITYFSASKCLNFLKTLGFKVAKQTLLDLEKFSESASIFYYVKIYSNTIKARSQYPRKVYAGDLGFYYAITGKIDYSRLYENIVYLELRRRIKPNQEIHYWKDPDGLECDFIIREGLQISGVYQVTYEMKIEKTRKREVNGIVRCAKVFHMKKGIIITKNEESILIIDEIEVEIIPLLSWLYFKPEIT